MGNAIIPQRPMTSDAARIALIEAELINQGSIELCESAAAIDVISKMLPFRKSVFVPATKKRPLPALIEILRALRDAGFDPSPHIAARRISASREIEGFLQQAVGECGVRRVLLIGGDLEKPAGPFFNAAALLRSGALQAAGVREVAFAGYPDGHPSIPQAELESALMEKLALAASANMGAASITQFSFVPKRIADYCAHMARAAPDIPVYVGMPGPSNPIKLLKYAKLCGVSASAKMLGDLGFKAVRLVTQSDPDAQLDILARRVAALNLQNVVGIHVYSFGDVVQSVKWMQSRLNRSG